MKFGFIINLKKLGLDEGILKHQLVDQARFNP